MIRSLQVNSGKVVEIVETSEAMTRGMAVAYTPATGKVAKATAYAGVAFVDVAPNYDGINSMVTPNDAQFETIASGAKVLKITPVSGEHYATNQITVTGLAAGDKIEASAGLLIKSTTNAANAPFVYVGAYDDPDFTGMYEFYVL